MSDDSDVLRRAQHRVGTVLRGKYRIDRILGVGGMATVYAATHRNQAQFALKLLHPEISIREDVRTRFLREGYVANSVKHPGAVLVVDDDVAEDGAAFLVMELLEGSTVEGLCDRCGGKLPLDAAVTVIDQLLDVLSAAHAKSIVHRDIKPANLLVTRDGTLKVLDFGIARARDAAATGVQGGTGTGMLLGTPAFMAPEQALAKSSEIDAQTDVWAAGATIYTLLAGRMVHDGENGPQLLIAAATTMARSLALVAPETPPAIVQVVDKALAFHKVDRWPSASAMREGLAAAWESTVGARPSRVSLQPFFAENPIPATQPAGNAGIEFGPTREWTPLEGQGSQPPHHVAPAATPAARQMTPADGMTQRSPSGNEARPAADMQRPIAGAAARVGGSTARPVSSPSPDEEAPVVPKHRSPVVSAVAVGIVVVIAGAVWSFARPGPSASTPAAAPAAEPIAQGAAALPPPAPAKELPTVSLAEPPAAVVATAPPSLGHPVAGASPRPKGAPATAPTKTAPSSGAPAASAPPGIPIQW